VHSVLPRCPGTLSAVPFKIGLGPLWQEDAPGFVKACPRLIKRRSGAVGVLAGMTARVEAATPFPRIFVMWDTGADRDRADTDIAIVDVPSLNVGFRIAATGEGGHLTSLFRRRRILFQDTGLLDHAREISDCFFADDGQLGLGRLPNDLGQVAAGHADEEAGRHVPSKRIFRRPANYQSLGDRNAGGLLLIAGGSAGLQVAST
jgi:hypothetical protein